jgi:hypothetical protein
MTIEQRIEAAALDFEEMILEGNRLDASIAEAAQRNELKPEVLEARLSRAGSIEALAETIRRKADHDRFLAVAKVEAKKFKDGEEPYRSMALSLLDVDAHANAVAGEVQKIVRRPLQDHEVEKVGDLLNPWLTDLRLQARYGLKPLSRFPFET